MRNMTMHEPFARPDHVVALIWTDIDGVSLIARSGAQGQPVDCDDLDRAAMNMRGMHELLSVPMNRILMVCPTIIEMVTVDE